MDEHHAAESGEHRDAGRTVLAERNDSPPRLLCNCASKKGPDIWALSVAMPGGKCPFASSICSRWCYADVGRFPLNDHIHRRNYEATKDATFAERLHDEIAGLAWRHPARKIGICAHEKGDFYSVEYLRQWGAVIRGTRSFPNVWYYVYTRSWINPVFRAELERIAAECNNVRIHLSLDSEMVEQRGVPARVGSGFLVYLAETDADLPPTGSDIVLRNLRLHGHAPLERLGGSRVCPNESGVYVAKVNGQPVVKGGRTIPVRCMDCRICIDRTLQQWDQIKNVYAGTPKAPAIGATATQPDEKHVADARQRR